MNGSKEKITSLEDLINLLKNEDKFIRTGMGHMWKMESSKLYYKPKGVNNFFEVEIEGNWFTDLIGILEVKNYKI